MRLFHLPKDDETYKLWNVSLDTKYLGFLYGNIMKNGSTYCFLDDNGKFDVASSYWDSSKI